VPKKVKDSGRAPSWKALAMALLENDVLLYSMGFHAPTCTLADQLYKQHKEKNDPQTKMNI
jgi:predicted phosphoadenosine phosphosulfate sulfurtransferase